MRALIRAAVGAAIVATAGTAGAYRTGHDIPELSETERVRWRVNRVHFEFSDDVPSGLRTADVTQVLADAFGEWKSLECGVPLFENDGTVARAAARGDGRNTVQWVFAGWTSRGFRADAEAVTDVQYARESGGDWEIAEADLYLNAEHFSWALGASSDPKLRDLHSVAFHEAGHAIGLLHPCEPDGVDGAPKCSSDPAFASTVMYPLYYSPRTMSADDKDGACFLYPPVDCDKACVPPCSNTLAAQRCGCARESCSADAGTGAAPPPPIGNDAGTKDPRGGGPGDPCRTYADCASEVCVDGQCSNRCSSDSECASTQRCDGPARVCVGPGKKLGETCSAANECVGGKCVAGTEDGTICSRACGDGQPECPESWFCQPVSGENVCTPAVLVATGGGGCSVVPQCRVTGSSVAGVFLLGAVLRACRKRHRRNTQRLALEKREKLDETSS